MTRYEKAAQASLRARLQSTKDPIMLWTVSCWADEAARAAGKKTELYASLYDYSNILPSGWRTRWLQTGGDSRMMHACPPGWASGSSNSNSLLLGRGRLTEASALAWGD